MEFDCHVHTTRSACGEDITDSWLCERAHEDRVRFTVTDHTMHLYYEPEIAWAMMSDEGLNLYEQRKSSGRDNILRYLEEIRSCGSPNMMVGVELDVQPDGQIMFPEDLRGDVDIMIAALHYMPTLRHKAPYAEVEAEFRQQTQWLLEYGVDVLAHPYRILLGAGQPVSPELVEWIVDLAHQHDTALEINSHKVFPEYDIEMNRLAGARGVTLVFGTDAHNSGGFGGLGYPDTILARAGVSAERGQGMLLRL